VLRVWSELNNLSGLVASSCSPISSARQSSSFLALCTLSEEVMLKFAWLCFAVLAVCAPLLLDPNCLSDSETSSAVRLGRRLRDLLTRLEAGRLLPAFDTALLPEAWLGLWWLLACFSLLRLPPIHASMPPLLSWQCFFPELRPIKRMLCSRACWHDKRLNKA